MIQKFARAVTVGILLAGILSHLTGCSSCKPPKVVIPEEAKLAFLQPMPLYYKERPFEFPGSAAHLDLDTLRDTCEDPVVQQKMAEVGIPGGSWILCNDYTKPMRRATLSLTGIDRASPHQLLFNPIMYWPLAPLKISINLDNIEFAVGLDFQFSSEVGPPENKVPYSGIYGLWEPLYTPGVNPGVDPAAARNPNQIVIGDFVSDVAIDDKDNVLPWLSEDAAYDPTTGDLLRNAMDWSNLAAEIDPLNADNQEFPISHTFGPFIDADVEGTEGELEFGNTFLDVAVLTRRGGGENADGFVRFIPAQGFQDSLTCVQTVCPACGVNDIPACEACLSDPAKADEIEDTCQKTKHYTQGHLYTAKALEGTKNPVFIAHMTMPGKIKWPERVDCSSLLAPPPDDPDHDTTLTNVCTEYCGSCITCPDGTTLSEETCVSRCQSECDDTAEALDECFLNDVSLTDNAYGLPICEAAAEGGVDCPALADIETGGMPQPAINTTYCTAACRCSCPGASVPEVAVCIKGCETPDAAEFTAGCTEYIPGNIGPGGSPNNAVDEAGLLNCTQALCPGGGEGSKTIVGDLNIDPADLVGMKNLNFTIGKETPFSAASTAFLLPFLKAENYLVVVNRGPANCFPDSILAHNPTLASNGDLVDDDSNGIMDSDGIMVFSEASGPGAAPAHTVKAGSTGADSCGYLTFYTVEMVEESPVVTVVRNPDNSLFKLPVYYNPTSLVFGDFNGDGWSNDMGVIATGPRAEGLSGAVSVAFCRPDNPLFFTDAELSSLYASYFPVCRTGYIVKEVPIDNTLITGQANKPRHPWWGTSALFKGRRLKMPIVVEVVGLTAASVAEVEPADDEPPPEGEAMADSEVITTMESQMAKSLYLGLPIVPTDLAITFLDSFKSDKGYFYVLLNSLMEIPEDYKWFNDVDFTLVPYETMGLSTAVLPPIVQTKARAFTNYPLAITNARTSNFLYHQKMGGMDALQIEMMSNDLMSAGFFRGEEDTYPHTSCNDVVIGFNNGRIQGGSCVWKNQVSEIELPAESATAPVRTLKACSGSFTPPEREDCTDSTTPVYNRTVYPYQGENAGNWGAKYLAPTKFSLLNLLEITFSHNTLTERAMKPDGESFLMYKESDGDYVFNAEIDDTFDLGFINGAPLQIPENPSGLAAPSEDSSLPDDTCQSEQYEVTSVLTDTFGLTGGERPSRGGGKRAASKAEINFAADANPETPTLHRCQQRHPYDPVAQACCVMLEHPENPSYVGYDKIATWAGQFAPECPFEDPMLCCILQNEPRHPGDPLPYVDYTVAPPVVHNGGYDPNSDVCECLEEKNAYQEGRIAYEEGEINEAAYIDTYQAYYCECLEGKIDPEGWCQERSCDELIDKEEYPSEYNCCVENDGNVIDMLTNCPADCGPINNIIIGPGATVTIGGDWIVQGCCEIIHAEDQAIVNNAGAFAGACVIGEKDNPPDLCTVFYTTYGVLPPQCGPGGEVVQPTAALRCQTPAFQILDDDGDPAKVDGKGRVVLKQFNDYTIVIDPEHIGSPGQPSIASIMKGQAMPSEIAPGAVKPQAVASPMIDLVWDGPAPTVEWVSEPSVTFPDIEKDFKAVSASIAKGPFTGLKKLEIGIKARPSKGKQPVHLRANINHPGLAGGVALALDCDCVNKGGVEGGACALTQNARPTHTAAVVMGLLLALALLPLTLARKLARRIKR